MKILSVYPVYSVDTDADTSYLDQPGFKVRKRQYQNGEFSYIGIWVQAEIEVRDTVQVIRSPGIWGVEDDGDREYITQFIKEEFDSLQAIAAEFTTEPLTLPDRLLMPFDSGSRWSN